MKRIFALFFALLFLLSCASCSNGLVSTETGEKVTFEETVAQKETKDKKDPIVLPEGFSAGYGRVAVNPAAGTALGGWSTAESRLSETVEDDICITCTALSDGKNVFLFYSLDALYVRDTMLDTITKKLENYFEGIHIPAENVVIDATHTHSAPILHYPDMAGMGVYMKKFYPAFWDITEEAIRDLAPATLYGGESRTVGLNYVRRYVSLDGKTYIGGSAIEDNQDPAKVRHETEADHQMQVLKMDREGKKDIVMVNWQCHPCTSSTVAGEKKTKVSADWVGSMRDNTEKNLDVHFAYYQGAAGNLASSSKIRGEKDNRDHVKKGQELALKVGEALENAKPLQTGTFKAIRQDFTGTHSEAYKKRSGTGTKTDTMYLNALKIGEVAFGTVPCELHDTLGMYVKEKSNYKMTFMCAYTNGTVSYVPSIAAFDNGGYETKMFHFERGTGEKMVETLVEMINSL